MPREQKTAESLEAELYALTTGIAEGMVTKRLLKELGYEAILVNHIDSQLLFETEQTSRIADMRSLLLVRRGLRTPRWKREMQLLSKPVKITTCEGRRRLGRMEHVMLRCMFQCEVEQGRLDDEVPYF